MARIISYEDRDVNVVKCFLGADCPIMPLRIVDETGKVLCENYVETEFSDALDLLRVQKMEIGDAYATIYVIGEMEEEG